MIRPCVLNRVYPVTMLKSNKNAAKFENGVDFAAIKCIDTINLFYS